MSMQTQAQVKTSPAPKPSFTPVRTGLLQRTCACGGNPGVDGECEECRKNRLGLQRQAANQATPSTVPPIVHEVLRSSGQALDAQTRAFMEPRFGHDFSRVKVHTDTRAAESARAVNALAYTIGRDVVFGMGQYQPGTMEGKRLLAHELTHVVQQRGNNSIIERISDQLDASEHEAESAANSVMNNNSALTQGAISQNTSSTLSRRVTPHSVHCTAGRDSAPADPTATLTSVDQQAQDFAKQIAESLAKDAEATLAAKGIPATPSATFLSYQDHFGLPPATRGGFLNRLTGTVRSEQHIAIREELRILSRRFAIVNAIFSSTMRYVCEGAAAEDCKEGDAASARDERAVYLCPGFWDDNTPEQQASILVHEGFHIFLGSPGTKNRVGEINDLEGALRGPGMNFNIAGCYENIMPDVFGFPSAAECPAPP